MSLPSLTAIAQERGIANIDMLTDDALEDLVAEAMRRDLPLAVEHLHRLSHGEDGAVSIEDPNSDLGRQLTRVCAGTILRGVASKRFCHGKEITFYNCCSPSLGPRPPRRTMLLEQIKLQNGAMASADC
ncbi:hypothetical protein FJY94_00075 [Candidatus Kaiserbacteria bacterium]|nr:hypothetical protein [Candidatus Kaiserbacteria bacterium]